MHRPEAISKQQCQPSPPSNLTYNLAAPVSIKVSKYFPQAPPRAPFFTLSHLSHRAKPATSLLNLQTFPKHLRLA